MNGDDADDDDNDDDGDDNDDDDNEDDNEDDDDGDDDDNDDDDDDEGRSRAGEDQISALQLSVGFESTCSSNLPFNQHTILLLLLLLLLIHRIGNALISSSKLSMLEPGSMVKNQWIALLYFMFRTFLNHAHLLIFPGKPSSCDSSCIVSKQKCVCKTG